MKGKVYIDHAATTPVDPRVLDVMLPYFREFSGNASSVHAPGRRARFAVESSRETIAQLLGAEPGEIVFTSGGTEANNLVIRGTHGTLVTSAAEHESVLRTAASEREKGRDVIVLDPEPSGAVHPDAVAERVSDGAGLVSLMHANNELGTLNPIEDILEVCHRRGVPVHCDAVQTAGYGLLRVDEVQVDFMTVSGHKFYGPKGVGALFIRGGRELAPLLTGGAQERRRRGGTENVPAIVGFAEALRLAIQEAEERRAHAARMRDRLRAGLQDILDGYAIFNTPEHADSIAPHILNLAFPPMDDEAIDGEMLLLNLDVEGVYASAGSACMSGTVEPSHVLTAIGLDRATAAAALRFSVGKDTTEVEVDEVVRAVHRVVRRMIPALA